MKQSKKLLSLILAALMLCLSVFGVSAAGLIDETLDMIIMGGEEEQEELMPMRSFECHNPNVPSNIYSSFDLIVNHRGADYYKYHAYENYDNKLPSSTTYTTYYITNTDESQQRLIIGADGSAYYSPDHYVSFYPL